MTAIGYTVTFAVEEVMEFAVAVVDVQEGLFSPLPQPAFAAAIFSRINALTARAREAGAPVIFIQHETEEGDLATSAPGWQLAAGLTIEAGDHFVRKTTGDSFLRTDLAALLEAHAVSHLIVCGYATEFCVDTTVRRAAALGYTVTLASDAHTTHDKAHADAARIIAHHNATLPEITSFGPVIAARPSAEI